MSFKNKRNPELEVKLYRKKYGIFAGASRLSNLFKTEKEAQEELEANRSYYEYWQGSISVSVENSEKKVINA